MITANGLLVFLLIYLAVLYFFGVLSNRDKDELKTEMKYVCYFTISLLLAMLIS